jgi:hypothetical protein
LTRINAEAIASGDSRRCLHAVKEIAMTQTMRGAEDAFGGMTFTGLAGAASTGWWEAQQAAMSHWQNYAQSWSQHRIEDFQSTLALAQAPLQGRDPEQIAAAQKKWLAGIVERVTSDIFDFAECACPIRKGGMAAPAPKEGTRR